MFFETLLSLSSCVGLSEALPKTFAPDEYVLAPIAKHLRLARVVETNGQDALVEEIHIPGNVLGHNGGYADGKHSVDFKLLRKRVNCFDAPKGQKMSEGFTQKISIGGKGPKKYSAHARMLFEGGYGSFYLDPNAPENASHKPYMNTPYIRPIEISGPKN